MKEKIKKKKISLRDWTYIGKCNYAVKWCRPLCSYYLIKKDETTYIRCQKLGLFAYVLLFIPVHLIQFFECLWDGGLREFTIINREIGQDNIFKHHTAFEHAEQIWNGEKPYKVKDKI
jgi:hypothetical protein